MSETEPTVSRGGERLSGNLGPVAIIFMTVAAASPLFLLSTTGIMMGLVSGAATPVMFVLAAILLLLFAVGFGVMAHEVKGSGGFYTYIVTGLGRVSGCAAAILALFAYVAIQSGVTVFVGFSVSNLLSSFGLPKTPWYAWALVALALVGLVGHRNLDMSAKVLGFLTLCELAVVVILSAGIVFHGGYSGKGVSFDSFSPSVVAGVPIGLGVLSAFGGFIGFEATAIYRDEARDPRRTIPRATYGSIILLGVVYTISSWLIVEAWGATNIQQAALNNVGELLQVTATNNVGSALRVIINVLLVTSSLAGALAFQNVLSRYAFSLAHLGLLPRRLARVHAKFGSPSVASAAVLVLQIGLMVAWILVGWDPLLQTFTWASTAGLIAIVILYILTSLSVIRFFVKNRVKRRKWSTKVAPALATIGLGLMLYSAIDNMAYLVGTHDERVIISISASPFIAGAAGVCIAFALRARRSEVYEALARDSAHSAVDRIL